MYKFKITTQKTNNYLAVNTRPRLIPFKSLVFKGRKITENSHSCSSCK